MAAASVVALSVGAAPAAAQSTQAQQVTVEAQPLEDALIEIARRYGVSVIASPDLVRGKRSPRISGSLSAAQALSRALAGSELTYERSRGGFVISTATQTTASQPTRGRAAQSVLQEDERAAEQEDPSAIIVTGRFQDSLIDRLPVTEQELPFVLNSVDRETIDKRNFVRPIDVLDTLPNVQLAVDQSGYGTPIFQVRGFTAPVLVNNRLVTSLRGIGQRDDSFVEKYEVLKGPASISLGPIDGGGVINTVTKLPQPDQFLNVKVAADNFGSLNTEFDFNAGETTGSTAVGFRISGALRDFGFDAPEEDRREFAIRPVITLNSGIASGRLSVAFKEFDTRPNSSFPLFTDGSFPSNFDTGTFFGLESSFADADDLFIDGQANFEFLDGLKLTLRGSYQDSDITYRDRSGLYNYANGVPGVLRSDPVAYSYSTALASEDITYFGEAQLLYTFDVGGLDQSIVVGGAINDTSRDVFGNGFGAVGPFSLFDITAPRVGTPDGEPNTQQTVFLGNKLYSAYAEFVIRPFERLSIVGGLRYDDFDNSVELIGVFRNDSAGEAVTGRIGASYEVAQNVNIFVSFAEAFTPQNEVLRSGEPVGEEFSRNIEIGVKGEALDGALSFDLGAFSTDRANVAVDDPANIPPQNFAIPITAQTNRGIEASIRLNLESGFGFELNYGYLDQDIEDIKGAGARTSFPDHSLSFFGTYKVSEGSLSGLEFGGGARYFSERPSAVPDFEFPGVFVADAVASYPINQSITASVNVLNLFDELYLESAGATGGTFNGQQQFGRPRTIVFALRGSF